MAEVIFNSKKINPRDEDYLNALKKDIMLSLNCHGVGIVKKVNKEKKTVEVELVYKKTIMERDSAGRYLPRLQNYPILLDCPFVSLFGGRKGLKITPVVGDECVVLFNDRSIDEWWFSGATTAPLSSNRTHSLSDAIVIVGIKSSPNASDELGDDPVLFNEKTIVKVGSKVTIENDAKNLNNVLQDLISKLEALSTQISAITVICAAPSSPSSAPVNKPAIDAIKAQITQIGTDLGELLE